MEELFRNTFAWKGWWNVILLFLLVVCFGLFLAVDALVTRERPKKKKDDE